VKRMDGNFLINEVRLHQVYVCIRRVRTLVQAIDTTHGRSVPDAGTFAIVTAILLRKHEKCLVGIYLMVPIVRAIDNTLFLRWSESPSAKLDDLRWRGDNISMPPTLQACCTGLLELHCSIEKLHENCMLTRKYSLTHETYSRRLTWIKTADGDAKFCSMDHGTEFTCTTTLL
jgi:hypothetical protein